MIRQLHLKNFKGIADESFEMAPLTLLAGANGLGKSSIIQSLLLLRQSYDFTYLQNPSQPKVFLGFKDTALTNLETAEDLCNNKADPKRITIAIETDDNSYNWMIDASDVKENSLPCTNPATDTYLNEALFKKTFSYLTAERWGPRAEYDRNPNNRPYNTKLGVQGELTPPYIINAASSNERIGIDALKHHTLSSSSFQLYENLNAWLSDILSKDISAEVNPLGEKNVKLSYKVKGENGGSFSALQSGFGFSFSLPVILAPLIAKPGDLIIIENPEAHLHPSAQSKIGKLLSLAAQNGVQVIVETHSDHILNGIRVMVKGDNIFGKLSSDLLKVHFFHRQVISSGEVITRRLLKSNAQGKLDGWPSGFFDEWEINLRTLTAG